jgi:hypothetical protein
MKNTVLFIIISLVLVSCNSKNTSQKLIVKIYNNNGSSPKTGEVVQYSCQKNDLIHYKTNNGTAEIPLPKKGIYFLKFTGDNEETDFFSLYIESKDECELVVHLPKTKARPNFTPEYLSFPNIKFSNASSTTNRFAEIMLDNFKNNALSMDSSYYYHTNKKNLAPYVMRYSREILDRLKMALNTEKNTLVRGQLYIRDL